MSSKTNEVRLRVWGDFALFTRPEMKTERVSYDVMTPSGARGILTAVLWKPAIRWEIQRIDVLRPVRWTSVRRNEVGAVIPTTTVATAMKRGSGSLGMYVEEERQQRAGLLLRDVDYVIHARFHMTDRAGRDDNPNKFAEMFRRRAARGQCFMQPYLGCREFSSFFASVEGSLPEPISETRDLGWMLHDLDYADDGSGAAAPRFFQARLENGVMHVPPADAEEVRG
jgi:CRISPR-associated protein Cas5d